MPLQLTLRGIAHSVFGAELPLHTSISGFGDLEISTTRFPMTLHIHCFYIADIANTLPSDNVYKKSTCSRPRATMHSPDIPVLLSHKLLLSLVIRILPHKKERYASSDSSESAYLSIFILDCLVQLRARRDVVVHHEKMKLFLPVALVDGREQHAAGLDAHHGTRRQVRDCNQGTLSMSLKASICS